MRVVVSEDRASITRDLKAKYKLAVPDFPLAFVLAERYKPSNLCSGIAEARMRRLLTQKTRKPIIAVIFMAVLAALAAAGCSSTATESQQAQPPTVSTPAPPPEVGTVYLDDVRVPSELNYDAADSIVYETAQFKAGILRFSKWRVSVPSVIDFFMLNMVKDKWAFVNAFKGKEALLSFSKPDKTCLIRITESWTGMTRVMITVGPLGEKKK